MYHPKKYEAHNKALKNFIIRFNKVAKEKGNEIQMHFQEQENFKDDGSIVYLKENFEILYDFEKRFTYYDCCGSFEYDTLGQFERKIRKQDIKLSIQCSTDEDCFLVAWHDDYIKEDVKRIGSLTGSGSREHDGKRFTKDFIELSYNEFDRLHDVLFFAFKTKNFNKKSFSVL